MTRHRFDAFSAVAGLLCLGLAVIVGVRPAPLSLADLQLIGPVAVLLLGVALLVSGSRDVAVPDAVPPPAGASQSEPHQQSTDRDAGDGGDGHRGDG